MGATSELKMAGMMTSELELRALMLASQGGDAASHRTLLERLSRHLRAYYKRKLASFGKGATEAEDLVQEALLAIHIQRHTYDPAELLTPWVHAIARYKLIDFLRRSRTSRADVSIDEADEIMARDDHVAAENSYDIRRLIRKLPKNMQCAIEGVKLEGLSIAEAAQRYRLSEPTVKVSIHRGLRALADLIAKEVKA
jgi:RNA polymerase sigma-70 factor (ECF subfamily)